MTVQILVGDSLTMLKTLPDQSVHCCVTSPPYYGLRNYGVDGQIGLEASPAEFIARMVEVFEEVRRVLRPDGTCWVNMGDSYAGNRGAAWGPSPSAQQARAMCDSRRRDDAPIPRSDLRIAGLKSKDLVGMPWRLAFALQDAGWWLRQDIIWSKPNPMPESVRDRCTKAHEYIFLLSKSEKYFYDQEAIAEKCSENTHPRRPNNGVGFGYADADPKPRTMKKPAGWATEGAHTATEWATEQAQGRRHLPGNKTHKGTTAYENGDEKHRTKEGLVKYAEKVRKLAESGSGTKNNASFDAAMSVMPETRNKRSVWQMATHAFPEAHFATFPPELPETCIKAGCPAGGTVLDPFFGAGTTGLVADRLSRNCIGIELNPEYAEMARRRIQGDAPLLAEVI